MKFCPKHTDCVLRDDPDSYGALYCPVCDALLKEFGVRQEMLSALKCMVATCDCIYGDGSTPRSRALAAIRRAESKSDG